jgi:hypothetical protein
MGTSSSNRGMQGNTPLVPTWADEDGQPSSAALNAEAGSAPAQAPVNASPTRFQAPRTNFSRFVSSSGTNRSALRRAVAGYVAGSVGGAANAARKMGAARKGAHALFSLLQTPSQGARDVLGRPFDLERYRDKDIADVLLGLADALPADGSVDAGVAREAMCETAAWAANQGFADIEHLNREEIQEILATFISFTIVRKLENEIGNNTVCAAKDLADIEAIEAELRDFVDGAVHDALARPEVITSEEQLGETISSIYEAAYEILQQEAEDEG